MDHRAFDELQTVLTGFGRTDYDVALLEQLVEAGAIVAIRDHDGHVAWSGRRLAETGAVRHTGPATPDDQRLAPRFIGPDGAPLPPGHRAAEVARQTGRPTLGCYGIEIAGEPTTWLNSAILPLNQAAEGWSVLAVALPIRGRPAAPEATLAPALLNAPPAVAHPSAASRSAHTDSATEVRAPLEAFGAPTWAPLVGALADAGAVVTVRDTDGGMTWSSPVLHDMFQTFAQRVYGRRYSRGAQHYRPDGSAMPLAERVSDRVRLSGRPELGDVYGIVAADGSLVWLHMVALPIATSVRACPIVGIGFIIEGGLATLRAVA
jgi:hypothetical protein